MSWNYRIDNSNFTNGVNAKFIYTILRTVRPTARDTVYIICCLYMNKTVGGRPPQYASSPSVGSEAPRAAEQTAT